ncbi:MAG: 16S rRNA (guanine(527)-N(7))-methyltransferase RsmG [Parasphingorhabdus sp.]|nr:16S rRNA (guanine(527)-N(7))-methyltransferase RsmG [Parasphingorhabdus sp.]
MTEAEAREWLRCKGNVSRETLDQIALFVELLTDEMAHQNLISAASRDHIWARHIVDSAQLLAYADDIKPTTQWIDLGTGAGFPGIIIALLRPVKMHLVESRKRRCAFLQDVVRKLQLQEKCNVHCQRLEQLKPFNADVISARAFAPLPKLLKLANPFSTEKTIWLLPKGRNAVEEWQSLDQRTQKMFHVEQSCTDAEAGILVGRGFIVRERAAKP